MGKFYDERDFEKVKNYNPKKKRLKRQRYNNDEYYDFDEKYSKKNFKNRLR